MADIQKVIAAIAPLNNVFRDRNSSTKAKLIALWQIGDTLLRHGVSAPHSYGWQVQKATNGLIKRPTIFRSFKLRKIWPAEESFVRDVGGISGLSNLTEMIPLIDPEQDVRSRLDNGTITAIFQHACHDDPGAFKKYIKSIKVRFSHGRLGQPLDKVRHLREYDELVDKYRSFHRQVQEMLMEQDSSRRNQFQESVPPLELISFSNMCLALTTKDNFRLYKRLKPETSTSTLVSFNNLYQRFRSFLSKQSDEERARLRRVLTAQELAHMSDMISSIRDEQSVADFRERRNLTMRLQ